MENRLTSRMSEEAREAPAAVARLMAADLAAYVSLGERLRAQPPRGALKVALRAIPGLFCVTDSTAAAGMPDGEYRLGPHRVTKCLGGVRLADGTLAGSTLTMDQALRNLVGLGLSVEDASRRVSTHAADFLGLGDRGRLLVGTRADLVVLDADLQLTQVFVHGESIDLTDV